MPARTTQASVVLDVVHPFASPRVLSVASVTGNAWLAIIVVDISVSLTSNSYLAVTREVLGASSAGVVDNESVCRTHCLFHPVARVF